MAKRSKKRKVVPKEVAAPAAEIKDAAPQSSSWLTSAWLPLLLGLVAFLVYWPSLKSDFVYDARKEILEEGFITSISNLPKVLSLQVLSTNLMLGDRPGQMLYLMLNAAVWGKKPFGYHVGSNLLHAANVALVFVLLRRLVAREGTKVNRSDVWKIQLAMIVVTLIFALHPIAVEPVSNVSYSSDLLVTCFTLLALMAAMAFRPDDFRSALRVGGVGSLCTLAAVACKESGAAAAFILVVYWFLFRRGERKEPWFWFLGAALALTFVFLAARFFFAYPIDVPPRYLGGSFFDVFLIQPRLWVYMMGQLLWPAQLSADYTIENLSGISTPAAFMILAVVAGLQTWLAMRNRIGALGVAIYWLGLVTVSNFLPLYRILADRFYYLPLAGIAMQLLAVLLLTLNSRVAFWTVMAPLLVAIIPLTVLNFSRQDVFADEFSLWTDTIQASPFSPSAYYNLGNVLAKKDEMNQALALYEKALGIDPNYVDAHNNLGNALLQGGRMDDAVAEYQEALEINPRDVDAHNNLGNALLQAGQLDAALAQYQAAEEIDPDNADAHFNIGHVYARQGRMDDAMGEYQRALEINPEHYKAHSNLGNLLIQKGDVDGAMAQFKQAVELDPDFADAHNNLANVFLQTGRVPEAIDEYQKALALNPNYTDAHNNLGLAFMQSGRFDDAIEQFQAVLVLHPKDRNAESNLASALAAKKAAH